MIVWFLSTAAVSAVVGLAVGYAGRTIRIRRLQRALRTSRRAQDQLRDIYTQSDAALTWWINRHNRLAARLANVHRQLSELLASFPAEGCCEECDEDIPGWHPEYDDVMSPRQRDQWEGIRVELAPDLPTEDAWEAQ